jgi:hypothetical protein
MRIFASVLLVIGTLLSVATLYLAFLILTPQGPPIKPTEIQAIALVAFAICSAGFTIGGAALYN